METIHINTKDLLFITKMQGKKLFEIEENI